MTSSYRSSDTQATTAGAFFASFGRIDSFDPVRVAQVVRNRRGCAPGRCRHTLPSVPITVEPLTATIGAEIGGVALAEDLSPETVAEIRAALLEWKVIFFRDQHGLDRDRHVAFGRAFGELEVHPLTPKDQEQPEMWHSDVSWRPEPSMGSVLRAVELPPLGGDTLWADMSAAYDLLDDGTKECIDELVGLHDFVRAFGWNQPPEVQEKMRAKHPTQEHPVVRTHPETGRKTIYVNGGFTMGIKGMDVGESMPLLDRLQRQAAVPDVQCRFRGAPGTVAFWDNRATQHVVSNDFLPARRIMERVTICGDRPY